MAKQIKRQPQRKVFTRLNDLYQRMQEEYDRIASQIGLSCAECTDNCCTSYFQHHTYVEWAYLWKGLKECDNGLRERIIERAEEYVREEDACLAGGKTPEIMCPVNENGWCTLYAHRMMICRLHGVPNFLTLPDGGHREFPGCFVTQELTREMTHVPMMDRTRLYTELANLEMEFLGPRIKKLPRVNITLARMIVSGPPKVSV
jgi:predicted metal-binding protein